MEILIISGLSGSGKSRAAEFLEDIGYYIVDNLPAAMMTKFAEFCAASSGRYDRLALVYDVRAGEPFTMVLEAVQEIRNMGISCRLLFLDTEIPTIIKRYKETRRVHPLMEEGMTVEQAVRRERELMAILRERADFVLDTTALSTAKLRSELLSIFAGERRHDLSVNVMSFGFKYGIPMEADLVYDVRFLPNPYYVDGLRAQSGLDVQVQDYLFSYETTNRFLEQLQNMLDYLLPLYNEEGKSVLVICIGCTGGRHRSSAITHALAEHIAGNGYQVTETHRDISR